MRFSWIRRLGRSILLSLWLMLLGCGRQTGGESGWEEFTQVVEISMRGASAGQLDRFLETGVLGEESAFGRIARGRDQATHLKPVINAVTATNAATFDTGALPHRHGIVGNSFRLQETPFSRSASGFGRPLSVEAVWEAADRQGKRVIRIGSILLHGSRTRHERVKTLGQAGSVGASKHVALRAEPPREQGALDPSLLDAFEHVRKLTPAETSRDGLRIEVRSGQGTVPRRDLVAYAVDAVRDGREQYGAVVLDDDGSLANGTLAQIAPGAWAPLSLEGPGSLRIGAWIKLMELTQDGRRAELYIRPPRRNRGYPETFLQALESAIGFPPGGPNWQGYFSGLLDEETILQEIEREVEYVMDASFFVLENEDFDLLQIDHPLLDRLGHAFYLTDPRQPAYSEEEGRKRERFAGYLEDGYKRSDANLQRLLERLAPTTHVVVSSGHGFTPVHSSIAVNLILAEAGFAVFGGAQAEVRLLSSRVSGHLYLNLEGREPGGVVPADQRGAFIGRMTAALDAFRDPRDGREVFELVLPHEALEALGIRSRLSAGDVWALLKPGYTMHAAAGPDDPLIATPFFLGEHGYGREDPEAFGVFLYAGPRRETTAAGEVEAAAVGGILCDLLGIEPPQGSEAASGR